MPGRAFRTGVALASLALATLAAATHEPNHRFIVLGVVSDAAGRPVPDAPVVVTRPKTGLRYTARTERDGFYLVVVHLHDEDEGEPLRVEAGGDARIEIRARFEVGNRRVERGTRVDFRNAVPREDRAAFAPTLRDWLAR